jgi:hypothetical protein
MDVPVTLSVMAIVPIDINSRISRCRLVPYRARFSACDFRTFSAPGTLEDLGLVPGQPWQPYRDSGALEWDCEMIIDDPDDMPDEDDE